MKNTVIIGAGPAGLTAAYELLANNENNVIIIEKCLQVGGISKTVNVNNNRMDLGGHRFFSKDKEICDWWLNICPLQGKPAHDDIKLDRKVQCSDNGPDPEVSDNVMLNRKRVSRIYYNGKFFEYPIKLNLSTVHKLGFVLAFKSIFSYIQSCFRKLPEHNLENFYINRFGKVLYSVFFKGYTEKLWGVKVDKISADWGVQRVKGISITEIIRNVFKSNDKKETSLIEHFWYPKYGPGQMWELVADRILDRGGTIILGSEVTDLYISNGHIDKLSYKGAKKGDILNIDHVISTAPIKNLVDIIHSDIPKNVRQVSSTLKYREFITIGVLVKRLELKNTSKYRTVNNIIPDCWIYIQDKNLKVGRIQIFNNWSPYMLECPDECVWIGLEYFCNEDDEFWKMEDAKRYDLAVKELEWMGILKRESILRMHTEKVKKAYPSYTGSYKNLDTVRDYLDTINNLICVGRNGQHRYNNMDHSMKTGMVAAKYINGNSKVQKSDIWSVNTEKKYNEE